MANADRPLQALSPRSQTTCLMYETLVSMSFREIKTCQINKSSLLSRVTNIEIWNIFCHSFSRRPVFYYLSSASLALSRLPSCSSRQHTAACCSFTSTRLELICDSAAARACRAAGQPLLNSRCHALTFCFVFVPLRVVSGWYGTPVKTLNTTMASAEDELEVHQHSGESLQRL